MENIKVLVVEDRQADLEDTARMLQTKGYKVISAKNGFEGVYLFDKESPQVCIIDWNLPGVSGADICRNFKKKNGAIPIIVLTVHNNIETKRKSFDAGAADYLAKPFDIEELHSRIQGLLQKVQAAPKGKVEYGDLIMDRQAHRVTRAGRVIDLSVTEYSLLEYLIENIDTVLTRKMILEKVWGTSNPETFTNIVDVYMNYLRKKVDLPGRRSIIKTVRGVGYMVEDLTHRRAA